MLIVFPFGELLRFDLGNNIRLKPLDIVAGLLAFSWIILLLTKRIKKPSFNWALICFPLIALVSLAVNSIWLSPQALLIASFYLVRWISYFSIIFIVHQFDDAFRRKILWFLVVDGLIIVLLGFVQYFFFSSLKPLYYLGWDDHMYRMFSVFLDPNYTGAFFVLYLLLVGGLLFKNITERKTNKPTNLRLPISLGIICLVTLIALFVTFSRSSLLMLIGGVSVFFVLIGRKKLIYVLFAVLLVFVLLISSKFDVENINLFRKASSNARLGNYQTASGIIQEYPVLGVGFNAYRYAKERENIRMGWANAPSHADAGVDNSFLFVLATTGVVGFVSYLFLWTYPLRRAFLYYNKKRSIFAVIFISSCVGLFIHAFFINSLFFPAIMLWMWLLYGLMERRLH